MRATKFEFERRFWIICAIYALGFCLFNVDHVRAITGLRHWLAPSLTRDSTGGINFARMVIGAGALLIFLAAALRTWGAAYLRTDVVHDTGQHSETLVADGPFRFVRNPLYLASVLMAAGIGLLASRLGWAFLVAANWMFAYRLIFREEDALQKSQGESFLAYRRAVPRFWPAFTPRLPSENQTPQWGQAFVGESFIWLFGIAQLCLALTLNERLTLIVFVLGFIAHFIVLGRVRKHASQA